MRICLVYDCLYPYTVGGAERWYRDVGQRLAVAGHEVTVITLRQWPRGERADVPPLRVRAVGPRMRLYVSGRRRIAPPLVFGAGVFAHLLLHGRDYDVVHTASFPYFSLLAAGLLRPLGGYRLVVDWHEVWSRRYWREYLGARAGDLGWRVQKLCARIPHRAFTPSRLYAQRLGEEGFRGRVDVLDGRHEEAIEVAEPRPARPLVVFAGRHIPEKGVLDLPPALARARERLPELEGVIFGDGPLREEVRALVDAHGLAGAVRVPGFVSGEEVDEAMRSALCLVLPSRREGYGLVVVEAAARGVPSVVVEHPDNGATELVEPGVNGFVAAAGSADALAGAIVAVHAAGPALRASTAAWFARNRERLSLESSLRRLVAAYAEEAAGR